MVIDGVDTAIQKEVKGSAVKKSAKGLLVIKEEDGGYVQYDGQTRENFQDAGNALEIVWSNGVWFRTQDLANVRANVADNINKLYA